MAERHQFTVNRRTLLIGSAASGALLLLWAGWPRIVTPGINAADGEHVLSAMIKVGRDGQVTVLCPQTELGQGAYTAIAQIAAAELGADWRTVAVEPAPLSQAYANQLLIDEDAALFAPRSGVPDAVAGWAGWRRFALTAAPPAMFTGGSTLVRQFEQPVREAAAIARVLLAKAAAARWNVTWEACDTAAGFVTHGTRRLRFGELAEAAAAQTPPDIPPLRPIDDDSLSGQALPRLDLPAKIDGSFGFAGDIRLPGLVYAAVREGPWGDSRLVGHDAAAVANMQGFLSAVTHERWLAAVATNSWAAQRALDAMAPRFRTSGLRADSQAFERRLKAAVTAHQGFRIVGRGDVGEAFAGRPVIAADYHIAPALHAQIEPRAATAAPDGDRIRLWVASQAPAACRAAVATALGVGIGDVILFPMPAGGSTGAAMEHGIAIQAALIARATGRPVQLTRSRTEDILQDMPRAPARARMVASLSSGATVDGWQASIATPAARLEWRARVGGAKPLAAAEATAGDADAGAVADAVPPYLIPNLAIDHLPVQTGLPAGYWRSNAASITGFLNESFVDELASAARVDPLSFRMGMLGDAPRLARCLQAATALGGWNGGGSGSGQGLAAMSLRGSHIAMMAEARPGERGLVVERFSVAVDCGRVINPTLVRQQIEGGLIFGLAMAVGATSRYRRGLAQARRLADLNLPLLGQTPQIDIELISSRAAPGGVSEIAVPLVAPAIANALFTITGQRIRRLPLNPAALP